MGASQVRRNASTDDQRITSEGQDARSAAQGRWSWPFVSIAVMPPMRLMRWLYKRLGGEIRGGYIYTEKDGLS